MRKQTYYPGDDPKHPMNAMTDEEIRRMQVVANITQGQLVQITGEEYEQWGRSYIQTLAAQYIDWKDNVRAKIALSEVQRLDGLFGATKKEGDSA